MPAGPALQRASGRSSADFAAQMGLRWSSAGDLSCRSLGPLGGLVVAARRVCELTRSGSRHGAAVLHADAVRGRAVARPPVAHRPCAVITDAHAVALHGVGLAVRVLLGE